MAEEERRLGVSAEVGCSWFCNALVAMVRGQVSSEPPRSEGLCVLTYKSLRRGFTAVDCSDGF